MKVLIPILALYFLVLFPTAHFVFSDSKFLYEFWQYFYFALALAIVLRLGKVSLAQLGLSKANLQKPMVVGSLLGVLPILGVVLLDDLLIRTGLSNSDLLVGATMRNPEEMGFNKSIIENSFRALLIPLIDQLFVVGLIVNNLLNKENTERVIISGGLIYPLIHFRPSIGNLFLGLISAGLLKTTGSVIVPIMMHVGFAITELLIVFNYPRLITMLVFLV